MILVIQTFVYPNAYNDHLVWGSILLLVLTSGPGVFLRDYLIERAVTNRRRSTMKGSCHRRPESETSVSVCSPSRLVPAR